MTMVAFVMVAVLGIDALIAITTIQDKAYHFWFVGLLLVMFWIHNSGLKSKVIIAIHLFLLLSYNITAIFFQQLHRDFPEILAVNNCFILTAILLSYLSVRIIESFIEQDQRVKKELHEVLELKEGILSVISHDVRGPVASVKGLVDLCAKGIISPKELQDNSKNLAVSVDSLQGLLDAIFIWTSGNNANFPVTRVSLKLRTVVSDVYNLFKPYSEGKLITLDNQVEDDIIIHADLAMLNLILRAIISNSFKLAFSSKKITITAESTVINTCIYVHDSGWTMDREMASAINNKMYGISCINSAKVFGLGICKELVEKKHGGSFTLHSHIGEGTVICCKFPNPQHVRRKGSLKDVLAS